MGQYDNSTAKENFVMNNYTATINSYLATNTGAGTSTGTGSGSGTGQITLPVEHGVQYVYSYGNTILAAYTFGENSLVISSSFGDPNTINYSDMTIEKNTIDKINGGAYASNSNFMSAFQGKEIFNLRYSGNNDFGDIITEDGKVYSITGDWNGNGTPDYNNASMIEFVKQ